MGALAKGLRKLLVEPCRLAWYIEDHDSFVAADTGRKRRRKTSLMTLMTVMRPRKKPAKKSDDSSDSEKALLFTSLMSMLLCFV